MAAMALPSAMSASSKFLDFSENKEAPLAIAGGAFCCAIQRKVTTLRSFPHALLELAQRRGNGRD
jgi:hypothetical protein